jgi:hypothetical protein
MATVIEHTLNHLLNERKISKSKFSNQSILDKLARGTFKFQSAQNEISLEQTHKIVCTFHNQTVIRHTYEAEWTNSFLTRL